MTFRSVDPIGFESVSAVTATNTVELGTTRVVGSESYIYVYNDGGEQVIPGKGVVVSGLSGMSVTLSSVTGVDQLIGVVKHATLTTATYGWVVTRGFVPVKCTANSIVSAGDPLILGADGLFAALLSGITSLTKPDKIYGKCVGPQTASAGATNAWIVAF